MAASDITDALQGIAEYVGTESVYGDAVEVGDRTVIPVSKVRYGFGGGFGEGSTPDDELPEEDDADSGGAEPTAGSGGGFGGGITADPVGVVEVSDEGTRFVRFTDWKRVALLVTLGCLVGWLTARRGRD